jgi:hypothetical protein
MITLCGQRSEVFFNTEASIYVLLHLQGSGSVIEAVTAAITAMMLLLAASAIAPATYTYSQIK